jgi:hypothetical protein
MIRRINRAISDKTQLSSLASKFYGAFGKMDALITGEIENDCSFDVNDTSGESTIAAGDS